MKALLSIVLLLAFSAGVLGNTPEQIAEWKEAAERGEAAAQHNLEGIKFYNNGNWKEAEKRFKFSIGEDSSLPEAHFNLALTQHKLGQHGQAKQHFKIAGELSPKNKEIVGSSIYRNHLGLSSTFERHISGGYRYE